MTAELDTMTPELAVDFMESTNADDRKKMVLTPEEFELKGANFSPVVIRLPHNIVLCKVVLQPIRSYHTFDTLRSSHLNATTIILLLEGRSVVALTHSEPLLNSCYISHTTAL